MEEKIQNLTNQFFLIDESIRLSHTSGTAKSNGPISKQSFYSVP